MESKWKSILFRPVFTIRPASDYSLVPAFLWGFLLNLIIVVPSNIYANFFNVHDEVGDATIMAVLYFGCSLVFLWGTIYGFFSDKRLSAIGRFSFISHAFPILWSACLLFVFVVVVSFSFDDIWKFLPNAILIGIASSIIVFLIPFFSGYIFSRIVRFFLGIFLMRSKCVQ